MCLWEWDNFSKVIWLVTHIGNLPTSNLYVAKWNRAHVVLIFWSFDIWNELYNDRDNLIMWIVFKISVKITVQWIFLKWSLMSFLSCFEWSPGRRWFDSWKEVAVRLFQVCGYSENPGRNRWKEEMQDQSRHVCYQGYRRNSWKQKMRVQDLKLG